MLHYQEIHPAGSDSNSRPLNTKLMPSISTIVSVMIDKMDSRKANHLPAETLGMDRLCVTYGLVT